MNITVKLVNKAENVDETKSISRFIFNLESLPQRKVVFFGETINGFVILETKRGQNRSSDIVDMSFAILPEKRQADDVNFGKEEKDFKIVLDSKDIVKQGFCEDDSDTFYTVWKFNAFVPYSMRRYNRSKLLVDCQINEKKESFELPREDRNGGQDKILENYVAGDSRNLLSELNFSVADDEIKYGFVVDNKSESAEPHSNGNEKEVKRYNSLFEVPLLVSAVVKLKSVKPAGRNNILLATVSIELSEDFLEFINGKKEEYFFDILNLNIDFEHGSISSLHLLENNHPWKLNALDSLSLTYKIVCNTLTENNRNVENNSVISQFSKYIRIALSMEVRSSISPDVQDGNISNIIQTDWRPLVDFGVIAPPVNSSLKTNNNYFQYQSQPNLLGIGKSFSGLKKSLYKQRPSSNSSIFNNSEFGLNTGNIKKIQKSMIGTSPSTVTINLATNSTSNLTGLKLTFIGKLCLHVGDVVSWTIQAINNSQRKLNLVLLVQNPASVNSTQKGNSTSAIKASLSENNEATVYNRLQLYSLYNFFKPSTDGILALDNNVRIGPLDPNGVFETGFNILGLSKGIFNLNGIRIFDVNSGDGLDFGKLVEVFVV